MNGGGLERGLVVEPVHTFDLSQAQGVSLDVRACGLAAGRCAVRGGGRAQGLGVVCLQIEICVTSLQRLRRGHSSGGALAALPALAMTPLQPSASSTPVAQSALTVRCQRVTSEGVPDADSGTADAIGRLGQAGRLSRAYDVPAADPETGHSRGVSTTSSLLQPSNPSAGPCSEAHAAHPPPLQPPFIDLGPTEPSPLQCNGEVRKPDVRIGLGLRHGVAAVAPLTLTALEELLDGFGDSLTPAGSAPASPSAPPPPAQAPSINGWASFGDALALCYNPPAESDSASPTASAAGPFGLRTDALAAGGSLPEAVVVSPSPVAVRFQGTLGASNKGAPGALAAGQLTAASPFEAALGGVPLWDVLPWRGSLCVLFAAC